MANANKSEQYKFQNDWIDVTEYGLQAVEGGPAYETVARTHDGRIAQAEFSAVSQQDATDKAKKHVENKIVNEARFGR